MFKKELQFGLDNFSRQKVLTEKDSIAQALLNLLFMRPGQMPSLPHIGINVRKYLYQFEDEINVGELKEDIAYQCSELLPYLDMSNLQLFIVPYRGVDILMLMVPILVEGDTPTLVIGMQRGDNGNVVFNYQFTHELF